MSDTTDVTSGVSDVADAGAGTTATATKRRRGGTGLSAMLLPELQSLAASLGISGTARMRKGELITAITERQGGGAPAESAPRPRSSQAAKQAPAPAAAETAASAPVVATAPVAASAKVEPPAAAPSDTPTGPIESAPQSVAPQPEAAEVPAVAAEGGSRRSRGRDRDREPREAREPRETAVPAVEAETTERTERPERGERNRDRNDRDRNDRQRNDRQRDDRPRNDSRNDQGRNDQGRNEPNRDDDDDSDGEGGRRSRRSRFRDRRRGRDRDGNESGGQRDGGREPHVNEDDVLVPVAGILDVLDNYAFVRTTGYLSGPNDVYVSMSQVKKHGLRRGDAVTGAVRATPREGSSGDQRRDKYNPLVRLDTINGMEPEEARRRPEFYKLTPLYPQERLRLETEPHILTTRVIDLVMPIGKGQRALIVSPPKAGKTMVLQAIANAITHNNPECHLMVVLVDERPEEVTDMQRSVKGEVVAATFDRPPQDHTTVAELAIERAKRLVELGHDVVVLLDSVTRLGRSYNLAAPASGRIMSGGIDSTALYPPKRFLGAARNIENGGSLTILATALVETGSMMDTVIFEEFKGTGNAELKLDRKIADKRVFPAIDIDPSGTRKEEILLGKEELAIIHKLRKVLHSLDSGAALDLLLDRLKQTRTNVEFLMQIAKSTPGE
ncbi:transcription termination factor Rho [Paractinoplanes hotanensis]|uniref:Transcription termination factor Rho n=1 Tax=Paractinoplanes hotanensis TaxID=2906497 RepID=A0ABT0XSS8_9ACTN|nr:transcription termination factor Rho [Actinoplanes hotanensis]MCM4076840.1 transcription termination factor Rho [Actinoplanes hotanensis]